MSLAPRQAEKLLQIIELAMKMLDQGSDATRGPKQNEVAAPKLTAPLPRKEAKKRARGPASRRSGAELVAFRKTLMTEREQGVPVAEIARKHGISTAYIYQLKAAEEAQDKSARGRKRARR